MRKLPLAGIDLKAVHYEPGSSSGVELRVTSRTILRIAAQRLTRVNCDVGLYGMAGFWLFRQTADLAR
jgi:hypothetical protein